jgi:hypothetical protein
MSRDEAIARSTGGSEKDMNEGYLWDRSGEPEPEVARLEQLLGRLRRPEPALKRAKSEPWLRERPW